MWWYKNSILVLPALFLATLGFDLPTQSTPDYSKFTIKTMTGHPENYSTYLSESFPSFHGSDLLMKTTLDYSKLTSMLQTETPVHSSPQSDGIHISQSLSSFRRQNFKPSEQIRPSFDPQTIRMLNRYREFFNKHRQNNQKNPQQNMKNTERFYMGARGPIRHILKEKKSRLKYGDEPPDDDDDTTREQGDFVQFKNEDEEEEFTGPDDVDGPPTEPDGIPTGQPGAPQGTTQNEAMGAASRFTTRATTTRLRRRTTPKRVSFAEDCDYLAYYCLKAYETGKVCARTLYFQHYTFKNYCMVDYVNCMERYDIWQIAHMGECFELKVLTEYLDYPYNDDYFLDNYYVVEDM